MSENPSWEICLIVNFQEHLDEINHFVVDKLHLHWEGSVTLLVLRSCKNRNWQVIIVYFFLTRYN